MRWYILILALQYLQRTFNLGLLFKISTPFFSMISVGPWWTWLRHRTSIHSSPLYCTYTPRASQSLLLKTFYYCTAHSYFKIFVNLIYLTATLFNFCTWDTLNSFALVATNQHLNFECYIFKPEELVTAFNQHVDIIPLDEFI